MELSQTPPFSSVSASAVAATAVSPTEGRGPYVIKNCYSKKEERRFVEDWREGFLAEGELLGDQLPIIRVVDPKNDNIYHLERPFFLKHDGAYAEMSGRKVVVIDYAYIDLETERVSYKDPKTGKKIYCRLEPVFAKPLHLNEGETFIPSNISHNERELIEFTQMIKSLDSDKKKKKPSGAPAKPIQLKAPAKLSDPMKNVSGGKASASLSTRVSKFFDKISK